MSNIIYFIAGVDKETLALCSSSEKNKFAILGSLILVPIITSGLATAFCLRFYTDKLTVILLSCLVSSMLVFVIERGLISSLRPGKINLAVLFRVIMAFAMSMIVSELLTIAIFGQDLQAYLSTEKENMYESIYSSGIGEQDKLRSELAEVKAVLDMKEKAYLDEIDGRDGTGIHGYGPSAKAKELALQEERQNYEDLKLKLEQEMVRARNHSEAVIASVKENAKTGILDSIRALHALAEEDALVCWVLVIFHIFFLFLELMPLVIKLSFDGNQYYDIQDLQNDQQLEVIKVTSKDRSKVLKLQSECDLKQRELAIRTRRVKDALDQEEQVSLVEAQSLFDTLKQLEELAVAADKTFSKENADQFSLQLEEMFQRFLANRHSAIHV